MTYDNYNEKLLLIQFRELAFLSDGKPTQRAGIKINEVIYPTTNGVKKDELLEKVIEILNK